MQAGTEGFYHLEYFQWLFGISLMLAFTSGTRVLLFTIHRKGATIFAPHFWIDLSIEKRSKLDMESLEQVFLSIYKCTALWRGLVLGAVCFYFYVILRQKHLCTHTGRVKVFFFLSLRCNVMANNRFVDI